MKYSKPKILVSLAGVLKFSPKINKQIWKGWAQIVIVAVVLTETLKNG